jgi:nicotinate phosphoribosyltransferase
LPIDAVGVGTRLGVSADAPYLDSVYKLVAYEGRPVMKLSAGKVTLPGPKQVWRRTPIEEDVLGGRDEPGPPGFEPLLVPVMRGGVRLRPPEDLAVARDRLAADLAELPPAALDLRSPVAPSVRVSDELTALQQATRAAAQR